MAGIPQSPHPAMQTAATHAPGAWHDLKRDWQRWSRAERIAAECALGVMLVTAAATLVSLTF